MLTPPYGAYPHTAKVVKEQGVDMNGRKLYLASDRQRPQADKSFEKQAWGGGCGGGGVFSSSVFVDGARVFRWFTRVLHSPPSS